MHGKHQNLILYREPHYPCPQQRPSAEIEAPGRLLTCDPPRLFLSLSLLQPAHIDHRRLDRTRLIDDLPRLTFPAFNPRPQDFVSSAPLTEHALEQFPPQLPSQS